MSDSLHPTIRTILATHGMPQSCEHSYAYEGSSDGGAPWRCEYCGEEAPREWLVDQAAYTQEDSDRHS